MNMLTGNIDNLTRESEASKGGGLKRKLGVADEEGQCGSEVCVLTRTPSSEGR